MRNDHSKDPIIQNSIEFSLMVIKYAEQLESNKKHILAAEILKSGTSIGAHIMDAQSSDSMDEVMQKMKLADNAAHQTWYWFYLCEQTEGYGFTKELSVKLDEVIQQLHTAMLAGKRP